MKIAVLIPSFKRPSDLQRCLFSIGRQALEANQVIVVTRVGDDDTFAVARDWQKRLPLEIVQVSVPGVVEAMNAGLAQCTSDILALTDDDAAPRPDWLARIDAHFVADQTLGGVGGRDWVHSNGVVDSRKRRLVGQVQWFGRIVGNHHLGAGPPRPVHIIKGANCAFRATAIRPVGFERRLRGQGAQVHWEMCLCFQLANAGWRFVYDPEVAVDHFPAARFDRDQRDRFDPIATFDRAFNRRLAISLVRPVCRRAMVLFWDLAVGTRDEPGIVWLARWWVRGDKFAMTRYRASVEGFWSKDARQSR